MGNKEMSNKVMDKNFSYYMPTKIIYGKNSINNIDKLIKGRKTLLLTSSGFQKRGGVKLITGLSKHIVAVVSEINSYPEFIELERIYQNSCHLDYDLILAVGGGSVIDTAKFLSIRSTSAVHKLNNFEFATALTRGRIDKQDYRLIPIIAVPTTAGTASEITPWATIWDMQDKKKYSLHLTNLFPETALYDPQLTLSLPKDITIQTGLDVLSHALESIWNKNASPITVNYAIKSATLVYKYLPLLVDDLQNINYRNQLLQACMYAGMAFSNTQTAIAHAMSYYITAHEGTPHGIACSFTLPILVDNIAGKYHFVDEALTKIFSGNASKNIRVLFNKLNVSIEFQDYGIDEIKFKELKQTLLNNQRASNSLVSI